MRQVQLRSDDKELSSCVSDAEAGETVILLREGRPVAQVIPFPATEPDASERLKALDRLDALMKRGVDLGGAWNGRGELYERE